MKVPSAGTIDVRWHAQLLIRRWEPPRPASHRPLEGTAPVLRCQVKKQIEAPTLHHTLDQVKGAEFKAPY